MIKTVCPFCSAPASFPAEALIIDADPIADVEFVHRNGKTKSGLFGGWEYTCERCKQEFLIETRDGLDRDGVPIYALNHIGN